eukprot:gnl/Trimastix_PCT/2816.p1 GENE.gnl/Trimastix_PCT/2816~~gnl/Trimastix_PCT/2816.p1  ORF type:complete len:435 (+),score=39.76 gnl/Trimastix_PCT/2816:82-1386(+)
MSDLKEVEAQKGYTEPTLPSYNHMTPYPSYQDGKAIPPTDMTWGPKGKPQGPRFCGCFRSRGACICVLCAFVIIGAMIVAGGIFAAILVPAWTYCSHPTHTANNITSYLPGDLSKVILDQELFFNNRGTMEVTTNSSLSHVVITIQRSGMSSKDLTRTLYTTNYTASVLTITWNPPYSWFDCRKVNVFIEMPTSHQLSVEVRRTNHLSVSNAQMRHIVTEFHAGNTKISHVSADDINLIGSAGSTQLDYVTLRQASSFKTSAGTLKAQHIITTADLKTQTSAGGMHLKNISMAGQTLVIKASAGNVDVEDLKARFVNVSTSAGCFELKNLDLGGSGRLTTKSSAGNQDIHYVSGGDLYVEGSAGSVEMYFKRDAYHGNFTLQSSAGSHEASGPTVTLTTAADANPIKGHLGTSGPLYTINGRTSAGNLKLKEES